MKKNYWLILGMMVATGAVAQSDTNTLPTIPPPIVAPAAEPAAPAAAPAAEPAKKAAPAKPKKIKRAPINEPAVTLMPGAAIVAVDHLNVRGQAGLKGEVIARLNKGDVVAVLNQINLDKHETGEPAQWAKIVLPASTHVWVFSKYIDPASHTVEPKKLNLRAGPGENFSVLGVIEHGAAVKEITTKGSWIQIEPPETAYAFVAAMYLKQEASGMMAANVPASTETEPTEPTPEPAPTPTPVAETTPIVATPVVTEPAPPPATPETALASNLGGDTNHPTVIMDTNPPPPRIVTHEGVVKPVDSIIAPTAYVLYDPATGGQINYLYTSSKNLDIGRYSGMRIVVTGEEGLAKRWKDTPVLTIQRIVVLDQHALGTTSPRLDYRIPRQIN